jgi:hypothetical protein
MNQEEKSMGMWQKLFLGGGFSGPRLCLSVGAGAATTASFANTHTGRGCFSPTPTHTGRCRTLNGEVTLSIVLTVSEIAKCKLLAGE